MSSNTKMKLMLIVAYNQWARDIAADMNPTVIHNKKET